MSTTIPALTPRLDAAYSTPLQNRNGLSAPQGPMNNAILYYPHAMPFKDLTSSHQSDFAMDRRAYSESHHVAPTTPPVYYACPNLRDRRRSLQPPTFSPGAGAAVCAQDPHAQNNKKWYSANSSRDASEIARRRRTQGVAQPYLDTTFTHLGQPVSFTTGPVVNAADARTALRRVRAGGTYVRPKSTHPNNRPGFMFF